MNLVNFGGLIGDAIADTWMSIWLSINSMVYSIIELLYKVFVAVANVNLFGEDVFNKIVKRVYVVMAIAMLFIFAYNLVLMIINPDDKKSTGQMTKMIKETIISLVLIVLLPTIFNYMSIFQRHVLDSNILGQIILGDVGGIASKDELTTYCEKYKKYTIIEDKTDIGDRRYNWGYVVGGTAAGAVGGAGVGALIGGGAGLIASLADYFSQEYKNANEELFKGCLLFNAKSASSRGAATIAPTIFSAFYHPTNYGYFECADFIENGVGKYDSYTTNYIKTEDDKKMCSYYYYSVNMAKFTGSISAFNEESYFYSKVKKDEGTFEFNYILALVAGVLAVYMFACYTMSIGVRVAKLGFLQIISPLTVMMRIIPKKKEAIYDKWQKMLLDTYLDVFIRLLIIYFSLFSISLVPDVIHTLFSSFEGGGITGALVNSLACVVVILGILKFAQDAPGLFKEFFGGSGTFALKSPKKQFQENKLANGIIGATGTLANRAVNYGGNYKRILKDEKLSGTEKAWNAAKNTAGMLNPFSVINAARTGYDYTKDGKDKLQGINKATAESLTNPSFLYKAKKAGSEGMAQLSHYASTDYTNLQADKINLEIKTLDDLLKQKDAILKVLDSDKNIKNISLYYDRVIDEANKRNDFNEATRLAKEKKDTIKKLRDAIAYEKKNGYEATIKQLADGSFKIDNKNTVDNSKKDAQFTTAIENFNKQLTENFSTIKNVLQETNTTLTDIEGNSVDTLEGIKGNINDKNNMDFVDKIGKASERQMAADKNIINSINNLKQGKSDK